MRGFAVFESLLPDGSRAHMARRIDELAELEGEAAGAELGQEPGATRVADLINKDAMFDELWLHPKLLAAVRQILGDFRLSSVTSRVALPGTGEQRLHSDYKTPVRPGDYRMCNTIWLLDAFTEENGPTRVVPGSHRSEQLPEVALDDPHDPHPDEVRVLAPAGSLVVINSHIWHSGTRNRSDSPRRGVFHAFVRRDIEAQMDQGKLMRPETAARLGAAARYVLGA